MPGLGHPHDTDVMAGAIPRPVAGEQGDVRRQQVQGIRGLCRDTVWVNVVGIALMSAIIASMSVLATASAQVDPVSCGHFQSQPDAQEVLDSGDLDDNGRHSLDRDGDGIACEEAFGLDPNSPPPARDYVSCGHFETQEDAQEALDSGQLDENGRQSLDGDGDGIACERAFETTGGSVPAALPGTGTGAGTGDADTISTWIGMVAGMSIASMIAALVMRRSSDSNR
jgi:hypothetical protein